MITNAIKKILETLAISFLGVYLAYLVYFTVTFLRESEPLLGSDLQNYIWGVMFVALVPLASAPFVAFILLLFSFLDKRILNKWFVFGFAIYFFVAGLVVDNIVSLEDSSVNSWIPLGFILVSLIIVIILMNIKKWATKS